jgi:acyl carrier protein
MDSMMALEILAAIEKKYKIAIPEEKLAEFKTLSSIVAIAKEYLSQRHVPAA